MGECAHEYVCAILKIREAEKFSSLNEVLPHD